MFFTEHCFFSKYAGKVQGFSKNMEDRVAILKQVADKERPIRSRKRRQETEEKLLQRPKKRKRRSGRGTMPKGNRKPAG